MLAALGQGAQGIAGLQAGSGSAGAGGGAVAGGGGGAAGSLRPPDVSHGSGDASARQSKDMQMSPKTRQVYKAFSHRLRSKETQGRGLEYAAEIASRCLAELPVSVRSPAYRA